MQITTILKSDHNQTNRPLCMQKKHKRTNKQTNKQTNKKRNFLCLALFGEVNENWDLRLSVYHEPA